MITLASISVPFFATELGEGVDIRKLLQILEEELPFKMLK